MRNIVVARINTIKMNKSRITSFFFLFLSIIVSVVMKAAAEAMDAPFLMAVMIIANTSLFSKYHLYCNQQQDYTKYLCQDFIGQSNRKLGT